MAVWQVWRQDDNGNRYRMNTFDDRVEALARVLVLEAGPAHKQTYWVQGPPGPVCRTNRDLYRRLIAEGARMNAAERSLEKFLRAWWQVGKAFAHADRFDLDTVAAMVTAAGAVDPPPLPDAWRTASFRYVDAPSSYADWEGIVLSQIADLADLADQGPLDEYAYFGIDVPRRDGCVRATGIRWYNFDPRAYLECGMAGSLGGWDEADGTRTPVPGPVVPLAHEPQPGERDVEALDWAALAELARCGQEYE